MRNVRCACNRVKRFSDFERQLSAFHVRNLRAW